ncbi:MAG: TonB-dependent receptor plug domain-containing protein, partial [Bacteroidota bacterium]
YITDEVLISATRANDKTATSYSTVTEADIDKINFGQDLPFMLDQLPSTVVNSDAGAGVGYTGIRIRGTDPSRTNVTINGIPLNDPESHGVFWVNLPDLSSSVNSIQVQRGVGTSTNGSAAFGASINIETSALSQEPYIEVANSLGSFNTRKHTINAGTGLINNRFALDARLSQIASDGWVDRASSDLRSYFVSAGYYGKKHLLKALAFSGREVTYQSWFGIPESSLDDPVLRTSNFYTYENEVDNYGQDHYQLHYSFQPHSTLTFRASAHYTKGGGYFEQFRDGEDLASYGLDPLFLISGMDTITTTDVIRRRWLDNDFYGGIASVQFLPSEGIDLTVGGGWNQYDGDHFGEI